MTFAIRSPLRKAAGLAIIAVLGLSLTQCARTFRPISREPAIYVRPSERLFYRIVPFDSTVKAELERGGIDPARFEEEINAELRYRFSARKQEEAQDSTGAAAVLLIEVHHLQPGIGNAGTYGQFEIRGRRRNEKLEANWAWEVPSSQNKPSDMLARDLARGVADQLMLRIRRTPPPPKEPPPPLQLL